VQKTNRLKPVSLTVPPPPDIGNIEYTLATFADVVDALEPIISLWEVGVAAKVQAETSRSNITVYCPSEVREAAVAPEPLISVPWKSTMADISAMPSVLSAAARVSCGTAELPAIKAAANSGYNLMILSP